MITFTGIHHLACVTGDMAATVRFWRDLLGMRLVYGYGRAGQRQYFFEVSAGTLLSFFEWPGVERVPYKRHGEPVRGPVGFDHVSFGVSDEERLWELVALLEAGGAPVSDVVDHGFIRSVYAFDPNGIPIEFSCDVAGVEVRAQPRLLDPLASAAACEGPEPQPGHWPAPEPVLPEEREVVEGEGYDHWLAGAGGGQA